MGKDTVELRNKARRVKDLVLARAIYVLENKDKVDADVYKETYLTALKNSIPRSAEITGEDGEPINISFDKTFLNASNPTPETTGDSTQSSTV